MANPKKTTQVATTSTTPSTPSTTTPSATQAPTKKSTKKVEVATTEAEPVATPATPATPVTQATKAEATKTEAPKKSTTKKTAVESIVEAFEEAQKAESTTEEKTVGTRRDVTKQTVHDDFQALITKIQEEITKRTATTEGEDGKKSSKKTKETGVPVKFLRTINKRLATLQSDAVKMMKLKQKVVRNNEKSGLMKPVSISSALYKFLKAAGYDDIQLDQNYARVDITRRIHSYVKDNNLRKESDKRVILPDDKLSELLEYDKATATEEMTYFRLPIYLKKHFIS